MKWVDYREKLGLGFNNVQKFKMLSNMMQNFIYNVVRDSYSENAYFEYCMMTGETYYDYSRPYQHLKSNIERCESMSEIISKFMAFYNTYKPIYGCHSYRVTSKKEVMDFIIKCLNDLNIQFEILEDGDGIFVFPKGAKELDDALVSEPLEWLKEYPLSHKTFCIALKQYSDGTYIRDVADNLRKALEDFLREFLGNNNDFNKNKKEVENYLKSQSVDSHLITILCSLINHYYLLNNEIAKHNDKMDKKYLEYLLYQTGIFIRTLIVVKREENN